jgi:mono/diheme cytochrome c family protein
MKVVILLLMPLLVAGCRREMFDQPRGDPLKASDFFADGAASRPLPPNTVAQENFHANASYDTGRIGTNFVQQSPMPVTHELLARGRDRYNIYCVVCHGESGQGTGLVTQRGFPKPPSYDVDRLRAAPSGYFFDVMTRGYGAMFSYANRVNADDRWAIASYIRVLQLSHYATLQDMPPDERAKLEVSAQ